MRITNNLSKDIEKLATLSANLIKAESILDKADVIYFDDYKILPDYVQINIVIASNDSIADFYVRKAFIEISGMVEECRSEFEKMVMLEYRYNY